MPDIIQFNWTQIPEFGSAGVLADLTKAAKPYMEQLPSGVQAAMFWDGKVVAYPYEIKTKLFFYRKDMFAEAGIDPTQWKTVDDFIAAGKQFQEKFPESYIWNWGKQSLHYDMFMMVQAFGGRFNDEDGNYVVGTDPGMRQTFETLHKIKHAGIAADIIAWTPDWEKGFVDGVIAGQLLKSWFQLFLPKYAPDQVGKWEVTLWPEDIRRGGNASVYVVPAGAKHKKEAIKFLNAFRLDKEGSVAVYETVKITPITEEGFNDPRVKEPHPFFGPSLLDAYIESLKTTEMFPFSPKASLERAIIQQYLDRYMNDELSLDDALAGAQKDLESQLENAFD
jgi:ABC-type glycerol-3-phosphate transport system substrate-binding protein